MFARVFLVVLLLSMAVIHLLPEQYAGTVRMRDQSGDQSTTNSAHVHQTAFEGIWCDAVVTNAIEQLNLNVRWGWKHEDGKPFKVWEAQRSLIQKKEFKLVGGTNVGDLTVFDEDRNEAAEIANAVVHAYQDYRENNRKQPIEDGLRQLREQAAVLEAKIQAARTNVQYLLSKLRIQDDEPNTEEPSPTLAEQMMQAYNEQMTDALKVYHQLEGQLNQLKAMDPRQLRDVLPTATGDEVLINMLAKLQADQQTIESLTNHDGPSDLQRASVQSQMQELNLEIDARATAIMIGLDKEVASKHAALKAVTDAVETARINDQKEQERGRPYWEAKRDLYRLLDAQKILTAKIAEQELQLQTSKPVLVEIISPAVPGAAPVKPDKPLCLTIGGIVGLVTGWFAAVWSGRRTSANK